MEKLQVFKLEDQQWILIKEVPQTDSQAIQAEIESLPQDGAQYRIELQGDFQSTVVFSSPIEP